MTRYGLIVALCLSGICLGCDNDPGAGAEKAEVAEPVAQNLEAPADPEGEAAEGEGAPAAPAAGGATYSFSQEGSTISFVGAKVTGKHNGKFEQFAGTVNIPGSDPTKGAVKVEVEMASVQADDPKLTGHLKSEDFFHVEEFPKAVFQSTSVKTDGDKHTVTGNLTLHGITKSITFPATITTTDDKIEVDAEFVLNRKDFGIVYPGMPDDLIKDEVLLKLDLQGQKDKQS